MTPHPSSIEGTVLHHPSNRQRQDDTPDRPALPLRTTATALKKSKVVAQLRTRRVNNYSLPILFGFNPRMEGENYSQLETNLETSIKREYRLP